MNQAPPTPKGFRDIGPDLAKKRRQTVIKIEEVLDEFDFVPLETPTIEFASTLEGKYGAEERLIYKFTDRGERELALRYDLTVPLARYVATNNPKLPFRRYQIGQVFRGENPQAGRYREFTQFDFDTVGSSDIKEDAKVIACAIKAARKVGVEHATMAINDRKNFEGLPAEVVRAFDKLHKIGEGGVREELKSEGHSQEEIEKYLQMVKVATVSPDMEQVEKELRQMKDDKGGQILKDIHFYFDPTLARGLDYYSGLIFELKSTPDPTSLSLGGGGRYDNLIGMFSKKSYPAVGFSFGFDRLVEFLQ